MAQNISTFQNNEVIFREGVYERCMYDIIKGRVDIYVHYDTEDQQHLVTLQAGQFFGEIGITEVLPRTATAIAGEDGTELAKITTENFSEYFHDNPNMVLAIMRNMSTRLRSLTKDYMEACQTLAEAGENAKYGRARTGSLKDRLAKLVQHFKKPNLGMESGGYVDNIVAESGECYAIRSFKKNDIIFREGDFSPRMYNINWGSVGIYANYGKPTEKLLTTLKVDQFFGEMGLIDHAPRSATAVALENDTEVQLIPEERFADYLHEKPQMVLMMMQHLSSRLRKLTNSYMEICRVAAEAAEAAIKEREEEYWLQTHTDRYQDAYDTYAYDNFEASFWHEMNH